MTAKKRFFLFVFLCILGFLFYSKGVSAKILNKELVDKAVLSFGYSADFCPINLTNSPAEISAFFENKESFPCVGNNEELRYGQVTLYLRRISEDAPQKAIENVVLFGEDILRLDSLEFSYYPEAGAGGTFTVGAGETIRGLEFVKSKTLHRTHPDLPGGQEFLPDSGMVIRFADDGKADGILFIHKGKTYRLMTINAEVHDKILVDYTVNNQTSPSPIVTAVVDETANWKTYRNEKYGFEVKYYPELTPNENNGGGETAGQFTYLQLVLFGTGLTGGNDIKSPFGFEVKISNKISLENIKAQIVGHVTDKIDSEIDVVINSNAWKKINYKIFLTTDSVSITKAIIKFGENIYEVTASTDNIDQILSTFKFLE